jgi:hypothetical protein
MKEIKDFTKFKKIAINTLKFLHKYKKIAKKYINE